MDDRVQGAPIERLLPGGMEPGRAMAPEVAGEIATHQYRQLLGRSPTGEELTEAQEAGRRCASDSCNAEQFARPLCFALLSSAERLFY
jgi:hypothetical protein